jgi:hypothetical protein
MNTMVKVINNYNTENYSEIDLVDAVFYLTKLWYYLLEIKSFIEKKQTVKVSDVVSYEF